jgi:transcriptional antiterminator NusG
MAEQGMKWYVLRAVSGKEAKVKEYLEALLKLDKSLAANVNQILLPTEKYAQLRSGKRVVKERLFLPGYVLVEANLQGEIAHKLRFMPNVLGFLGGLDNPTPVRQADINRVLGVAEDSQIKNEESATPFCVDEAVKVVDGPFSGFSGVIEEVMSEKHSVKVAVKIFGRKTPLELDFNQVEKE